VCIHSLCHTVCFFVHSVYHTNAREPCLPPTGGVYMYTSTVPMPHAFRHVRHKLLQDMYVRDQEVSRLCNSLDITVSFLMCISVYLATSRTDLCISFVTSCLVLCSLPWFLLPCFHVLCNMVCIRYLKN